MALNALFQLQPCKWSSSKSWFIHEKPQNKPCSKILILKFPDKLATTVSIYDTMIFPAGTKLKIS